jgi:ubiquinone/menaquinone biosynthesis C-methylase UbiE
LDQLPRQSTESFAGVTNPLRIDRIAEGAVVVDIGCGAGMDLLLAAKSVGTTGRAIGIDMTESMRDKALSAARVAGLHNVEVRLGDAMSLPLDNETVDAVISNGVLNLVPDKSVAYREVFRVLKPGGRFLYGDIVVGSELSESIRRNIDLWTG